MTEFDRTTAGEGHPKLTDNLFAPGQILEKKYKIISFIGKGGIGTVYRVQRLFLNGDFALKVLDSRRVSDEVQMRRFHLEAVAANALNHPNLVKVHDFGLLDNNQPYLLMDLIEGITLADQLKEHGILPVHQALPLFVQLCAGLSYAHQQGVIHRDIKPSNIMLASGADVRQAGGVKIVDFGIAKLASAEDGEIQALTRTGEVFGSPLYMSPEQCSGETVDQRSDIYSLGCTFFEALTGTPPHVGQNALRTMMLHQSETAPWLKEASLGVDYPDALEAIIHKMLEKSPAARYENLALVAADLGNVSANPAVKPLTNGESKRGKAVPFALGQLSLVLAVTVVLIAGFLTINIIIGSQSDSEVSKHSEESTNGLDDLAGFAEKVGPNYDAPPLSKNDPKVIEKIEHARLSFKKAGPIRSRIVKTNNIAQREFSFPDSPIGLVSYGTPRTPKEAVGNCLVPTDVPMTLEVDEAYYPWTLKFPSIFTNIGAKEFSGLTIERHMLLEQMLPQQTSSQEEDSLAQLLTTASNWSDLKTVKLDLNGFPLSYDSLRALNSMKHLRDLRLTQPAIVPENLAQQPFLHRLERLTLDHYPADKVIPALSGSELKSLELKQNNGLSAEALQTLNQCPHLEYLQLQEGKLDNNLIQAISQLKSLKEVCIKNTPITHLQTQILTQSKSLKSILLSKLSEIKASPNDPPVKDDRIKWCD